MVDSKNLWLKESEFRIQTGLVSSSTGADKYERDMVYNSLRKELSRIKAISINVVSGWTEYSGYNTVYTLSNGHKVVHNDNHDYGTETLFYEKRDDCKAEDYKKWADKSYDELKADRARRRGILSTPTINSQEVVTIGHLSESFINARGSKFEIMIPVPVSVSSTGFAKIYADKDHVYKASCKANDYSLNAYVRNEKSKGYCVQFDSNEPVTAYVKQNGEVIDIAVTPAALHSYRKSASIEAIQSVPSKTINSEVIIPPEPNYNGFEREL
ncbi:hypothetical protein J6A31_04805 [bacterium]|nr:hypothetical protein [bacterium]